MPTKELVPAPQESAPEATLDQIVTSGLDAFEQRITEAELDVQQNPGKYEAFHMPEGFYTNPDGETIRALQTGEYNLTLFSRYVTSRTRAQNLLRSISPNMDSRLSLELTFDTDLLVKAFQAEDVDGPYHTRLIEDIQYSNQADTLSSAYTSELRTLQAAFGLERPMDLLRQVPEDPYRQTLREQLLTPNGIKRLYEVEVPARIDDTLADTRETEKRRTWMRDALVRASTLKDPELADDYIYVASRFDEGKFAILDIVEKIDALGLDRLATVREFTGICALTDYSMQQLVRMVRIAENDPDELERLRDHDVIVNISNKMSDHNWQLSGNPSIIDDENERALFFEIQSAHDILAIAARLRARGIMPSTTMFAVHGAVGGFPIIAKPALDAKNRTAENITIHAPRFIEAYNSDLNPDSNETAYALHDMKSIARVVEDYMQPSRGINDDAASLGAKKIIFTACYTAKEMAMRDKDLVSGDVVDLQEMSVISQLAADLVKNDVRSTVEIYGASTAIKSTSTPRGIGYTTNSEEDFYTQSPKSATRILIKNGAVTSSEVDEIPLRNFDKAV